MGASSISNSLCNRHRNNDNCLATSNWQLGAGGSDVVLAPSPPPRRPPAPCACTGLSRAGCAPRWDVPGRHRSIPLPQRRPGGSLPHPASPGAAVPSRILFELSAPSRILFGVSAPSCIPPGPLPHRSSPQGRWPIPHLPPCLCPIPHPRAASTPLRIPCRATAPSLILLGASAPSLIPPRSLPHPASPGSLPRSCGVSGPCVPQPGRPRAVCAVPGSGAGPCQGQQPLPRSLRGSGNRIARGARGAPALSGALPPRCRRVTRVPSPPQSPACPRCDGGHSAVLAAMEVTLPGDTGARVSRSAPRCRSRVSAASLPSQSSPQHTGAVREPSPARPPA